MARVTVDFSETTVFVAGGTSGINLGIAEAFATAGARVAVMSRSKEKVDAAVTRLQALGAQATGGAADVRDPEATSAVLQLAHAAFGDIDVLVSGAAGNFPAAALDMSPNAFRSVVDIDLLGTYNVSKASFDAWLADHGGNIVNISAPFELKGVAMQAHVAHYHNPAHYLRMSVLFKKPFWRSKVPGSYFMSDAFGGCCVYDETARHPAEPYGALGWLLAGIIVMMLGELVTGLYAVEGQMVIQIGESGNTVIDARNTELAIVHNTLREPKKDDVVVVVWRGQAVFVVRRVKATVDQLSGHDDMLADPKSEDSTQPDYIKASGAVRALRLTCDHHGSRLDQRQLQRAEHLGQRVRRPAPLRTKRVDGFQGPFPIR